MTTKMIFLEVLTPSLQNALPANVHFLKLINQMPFATGEGERETERERKRGREGDTDKRRKRKRKRDTGDGRERHRERDKERKGSKIIKKNYFLCARYLRTPPPPPQ